MDKLTLEKGDRAAATGVLFEARSNNRNEG
jgi:hypothetical protein